MSYEASVRITNPTGLHARPAVKLAQMAAGFDAEVRVRIGDDAEWVRARSTAKLMKLKAGVNATIHFSADGAQASDAVCALVDFVRRDFDEGPAPGGDDAARDSREPEPASEPVAGGRLVSGEVASEGIAIGRIRVVEQRARTTREPGSGAAGRAAFEEAVRCATDALERLSRVDEPLGAEIIAFQVMLLRDEDFLGPVRAAIDSGSAALEAWNRHLSREIADYERTEDRYFRDRAADLRDLEQRVSRALRGEVDDSQDVPAGAIVVLEELTPSRFLEIDSSRASGVVAARGGAASHAAMLARARGVPFIVGLGQSIDCLSDGMLAVLDAERGQVMLDPEAPALGSYRRRVNKRRARAEAEIRYLNRPARTPDGTPIKVYVNVDDPVELERLDPVCCDGVGLTRTEFLFRGRAELPDEAVQYAVYRRLVEWAGDRPVTIRTLDAGGDKPIPGLTLEGERDPFLGVRGLRLLLARPDVFRVQLRALARAAVHGELKIMLPMVSIPAELEKARSLLDEAVESLLAAGVEARTPALGMMVEVPAAALTVADFAAAFFSIGTNDLVQYVMAAGRGGHHAPVLSDPLQPAVLALIERVAADGARRGLEVSLCGEMASRPECIGALIARGVRVLSVPPARVAAVKAAIAGS